MQKCFKKLLLVFAGLGGFFSAGAQQIDSTLWVPNNIVTAMCKYDNKLYMTGGFKYWGLNKPYAQVADSLTGLALNGFPSPNGVISAVEPDGNGGYYISGGFSYVGDSARAKIAHVNRYGQVTAWNPGVTTGIAVNAILFDGDKVYIGGQFSVFGGQNRNNICLVDTSGVVMPWNPGANQAVYQLEKSGNKLYAAGFFTSIGSQSRNYIAQFDLSTGLVTSWNAASNNTITGTLHGYGNRLYVTGQFTSIGSAMRAGYAALDTITGTAFPLTITTTGGGISMMYPSGDSLIITGFFTHVNGQPRTRFAVVDSVTGVPRNWQPAFNAPPLSLYKNGNNLYVGGQFTTVNNVRRNYACSFDLLTGLLSGWDPAAGNEVNGFCKTDSGICLTGLYTCMNVIDRDFLAVYDLNTQSFTPLELNGSIIGNGVNKLVASGGKLFFGGNFTTFMGQPRKSIAAIDRNTGALLPWDPAPTYTSGNPIIYDMKLIDSALFVSGTFNNIGGQPHNHIAALDTLTGTSYSWNPSPNNMVHGFAVHDTTVYLTGTFSTINSVAHSRVGAVSINTGLPTTWNPSIGPSFTQGNDIHVFDTSIVVTGFFTLANGQPRTNIAVFGRQSGSLLPFNPNINNGIDVSIVNYGTVYISGTLISQVNSTTRNRFAALNLTSGILESWDIDGSSSGLAMIPDSNKIWIGGFFTTLRKRPRSYFAGVQAVPPDTSILTPVPAFLSTANQVKVYPNPAEMYVTVSANEPFNQISLYTLNGQLMHSVFSSNMISVADLSPGVYILCTRNKGILNGRTIVVRK